MLSASTNKLLLNSKGLFLSKHNLLRSLSAKAEVDIKQSSQQTNEINWNDARAYSEIPGPTKLQLIKLFSKNGEFRGVGKREVFGKLRERYGNLFRLPGLFGKKDIIFSFDPKNSEILFRNEGQWPVRRGIEIFNYYRQKIRPDVFKGMGGLVSDQGEAWAKMRTAVNPVMMQPKVVKAYIKPVDEVAREFVGKINDMLDQNNELPADFGNELNEWALESIGVIALDQRLGVMSTVKNPEAEKMIQIVKDFFRLAYQIEIQPSIWKYYATKDYKEMIGVFEFLTNTVKKLVDDAVERMDKQEKEGNVDPNSHSVLQQLLKINRHYAVLMAMDMLFAGIDTTSSASATLLYNLAINQDKQDRLRVEIFKALPNLDSEMTSEVLNNLPYLRACIKESMRLQPVVGVNVRSSTKDLVLEGYKIPSGTTVLMEGISVLHDNQHFPNGNKFLPERWLREEAASCPIAAATKNAHPFVYLPFGFGPRMCIGRRFAELEINILMLRILREYKVEWNYGPLVYGASLILSPSSPLKYKFTKL